MTLRRPNAVIDWKEHFPTILGTDLVNMLLGDHIGAGVARAVYTAELDPKLVFKLENVAGSFQNVNEWHIWGDVEGTRWAKWFAPCRAISPCGTVLIQERTTPMDKADLPKRVPSFMVDLKPDNWGTIHGVPCCHDYGIHPIMYSKQARMMKAKWRME